jgi:DNA-binding CsgD family transcriptional regulator
MSGSPSRTAREIALFGLALGGLLLLLQLVEIRLLVLDRRIGAYSAAIALVFSAVGLWLGSRQRGENIETGTEPRPNAERFEVDVERFEVDAARLQALGVTPREHEILLWIAQGLSNREIGERLFVSENTVKTHVSRLLDKLGARRRTEAVRIGRTQGLIS